MAMSTIDVESIASSASPIHVNEASFAPQYLASLPDITEYLSPYLLKTLEMLHKVHGSSNIIKKICLSLSYHNICSTAFFGNTRPTVTLENYNMKQFTDNNRLPSRLPFIADHCATVIPVTCEKHNNRGVMHDIVEAMRQTTNLVTDQCGIYAFFPPTTLDIQTYLSSKWPEKYPPHKGVASGWRNTVNQCLTHGQGWNFLTFPPIDGTKNKRHLLFERAFNGSYIVGSGQCKGLNDLKPKFLNRSTRRREQQEFPSPPTSPSDDGSSPTSIPSEWSLEWSSANTAPGESDHSAGIAAVKDEIQRTQSPAESGRNLHNVEADLIRMLMPGRQ